MQEESEPEDLLRVEGEEAVLNDEGFEPFNMEAEREEGLLDAEGTYRAELDPEAGEDRWLEGWTERGQLAATRAAQAKRLESQKQETVKVFRETDLWLELQRHLRPDDETVLQVLQKLKPPPLLKRGGLRPANPHAAQVALITDLCARLMDLGHHNVYGETWQSIQRRLSQ